MGNWKIIVSGSTKDLEDDYYFKVQQATGAGMPPIDTIATDFGLLDGQIFQRQRARSKSFTLVGTLKGDSISDLHGRRRSLIDAIKMDRTGEQEPVVLQYDGSGSTLQASCFYEAGLELGEWQAKIEPAMGLRFLQLDPYWEATACMTASLLTQDSLADANYIVQRDASGNWLALDGGMNNSVYTSVTDSDGTLYAGGLFTIAGSITCSRVAKYDGNEWSALDQGLDGSIWRLLIGPNGDIYAAGVFDNIVGGATACGAARWDGSNWHALDDSGCPGISDGPATVFDAAFSPDLDILYVGGEFLKAGSVSASYVAQYTLSSSAWSDVGLGVASGIEPSVGAPVGTVITDQSGNLYIGGCFLSVSGTSVTACGVAKYDGTTWSPVGDGFNGRVYDFAISNDGTLYAAGSFSATGGGRSIGGIGRYRGGGWSSISETTNGNIQLLAFGADGSLYAAGDFTEVGGIALADPVARFDGANWYHLDGIDLPGNPTVYWVDVDNNDNLTLGFDTSGTATVAGVTVVNNQGTATAWPVITISGSGRFYHIKNFTNDEALYFDINMAAGEQITIDLKPRAKTVVSNLRGNIINKVLPISTLSTWRLNPGNNNISAFHANSSASITLEYPKRYWSLDGEA